MATSANKDYLWKQIIWRMQSQTEGDPSQPARRRAEELANDVNLQVRQPPDKPEPTAILASALSLRSRLDSLPADAAS